MKKENKTNIRRQALRPGSGGHSKTRRKEENPEINKQGTGETISQAFKVREVTGKQWFWFLAVLGLLIRLIPLRFPAAETTDGVLCLTYFSPDFVQTPRFVILPGYPFLLWLGQELGFQGWLWGRLLSSLAGLLFLIPLWKFSRRWLSSEMTGMVCLMALFSPLIWQWSLKVMPDTLFLLLFWWGLERLVSYSIEKSKAMFWQAGFLGALSACVRPEGFLLLPWLLWFAMARDAEGKLSWLNRIPFFLLWGAPLYFLKEKILLVFLAYREGLGLTDGSEQVRIPFLNFIEHFYAYLTQPFYVFTPLVFGASILGLAKLVRRGDPGSGSFKGIVLQVFIVLFLSRLIPTAYMDRHMLPFLPFVLFLAGYQLESFFEGLDKKTHPIRWMFLKNVLLAVVVAWMAIYSSVSLIAQLDSFGDIKRSAEYLKTLPPNAKIYSDEIPKTQYWSGRKVELMTHLIENTVFKPKPGDYVVLHSFYSPRLNFMAENMRDKFGTVTLDSQRSMVVPLLTDIMSDPRLQNRVKATAYRFEPQFFTSAVYRATR